MEAAEVTPTADAAADRTVAALLEPGLSVGPRSIRPARVAVHKLTSP
jgi:molecular chaperone GrpE